MKRCSATEHISAEYTRIPLGRCVRSLSELNPSTATQIFKETLTMFPDVNILDVTTHVDSSAFCILRPTEGSSSRLLLVRPLKERLCFQLQQRPTQGRQRRRCRPLEPSRSAYRALRLPIHVYTREKMHKPGGKSSFLMLPEKSLVSFEDFSVAINQQQPRFTGCCLIFIGKQMCLSHMWILSRLSC